MDSPSQFRGGSADVCLLLLPLMRTGELEPGSRTGGAARHGSCCLPDYARRCSRDGAAVLSGSHFPCYVPATYLLRIRYAIKQLQIIRLEFSPGLSK